MVARGTVTPLLPDCSMWLSRPGSAEQPQQTDTQRELWLSFLARTPPTTSPSPVQDKATLWPQDRPNPPWMGSPRLLVPRKMRAALPSRRPWLTRTTGNILPAPSRLPRPSGDTCQGPQLPALLACRAHPHSRTQMLLHHIKEKGTSPGLPSWTGLNRPRIWSIFWASQMKHNCQEETSPSLHLPNDH